MLSAGDIPMPAVAGGAPRRPFSPLDRFRRVLRDAPPGIQVLPADWTAPLDLDAAFGGLGGPLEVDLGCGKGRFLLARAAANPGTRFLGIDQQGARLATIARRAQRAGLANIRLLYAEAAHAVRRLLPAGAARAIYVFFPDPWPKRRHHRRRLVQPGFLDALHAVLAPGGTLHVATDHLAYGDAIRALLAADARFAEAPTLLLPPDQQTDFERLFAAQGVTIRRCAFAKRAAAPITA